MITVSQLFGLLFIVYGIVKLIIFVSISAIPYNVQKRLAEIPGFDIFFTGDTTTAGKFVEWVLAIFAVFTIVHGLAIMNALPDKWGSFVESHLFQYTFYAVCGVAMIVFYSLVLYTNVPIEKNPLNDNMYFVHGYIVGTSFVMVPIIWELAIVLFPVISRLPKKMQFVYITIIFLILFVIAVYVYILYRRYMRQHNIKKSSQQGVLQQTDSSSGLPH